MTRRVVYVLPYQFYFGSAHTDSGGHHAHVVGLIEALVNAGFATAVVSDSVLTSVASANVTFRAPALTWLRNALRRIEGRAPATHDGKRTFLKRLCTWIRAQLFSIGLFITTWNQARRNGVEFVYMRHNLHGFAAALGARAARRPLVVEVNTPASMGLRSTLDAARAGQSRIKLSWREAVQYSSATVIAAVSPAIAGWITRVAGDRYADRIIVNPNGVNPDRFRPCGAGATVRTALGISDDAVVIGMAAAFRWYNAIEELVDAFDRARSLAPDISMRLLLVGDSDLRPKLEQYVQGRGLNATVTFTGAVPYERVPSYLEACDILVSHFNFRDVTPHINAIKQFEYLAMARPVVASDAGFANFAIREGVNGHVVAQGDIEQFASALASLATNPHERERLGRQGRLDAQAKYTWAANLSRITDRLQLP